MAIEMIMKSHSLRYFLHDERDAFRMELAGSLTGDGVIKAYQDWRTAASITSSTHMIVDITFVSEIDSRGRSLLSFWHRMGARLIAALPKSRAIAGAVLADSPRPVSPQQSWPRRLLAGLAAQLSSYDGIPAFAERHGRVPAPRARKHVESTAVLSNQAAGLLRASVDSEDLEEGNESQQGLTRTRSHGGGNRRSGGRGRAATRDC